MSIFDKILGALHLNFLNRKNSPFIKADGDISAGGDIFVGTNNKTEISVPDVNFRMTRDYISQYPPDKSHFGELTTPIVSGNNISDFRFITEQQQSIGRCTNFQKLTSQSIELISDYRIENRTDELLFLNTLKDGNGIVRAEVVTTNGDKFIYSFKAVQSNWRQVLNGNYNLRDDFKLIKKQKNN